MAAKWWSGLIRVEEYSCDTNSCSAVLPEEVLALALPLNLLRMNETDSVFACFDDMCSAVTLSMLFT